jgi:hypothetical protein
MYSQISNFIFYTDQAHIYSVVGQLYCTVEFGELFLGGIFWFFLLTYVIQHCFIFHPSDSTVSENAGIVEPRTVATFGIDSQTL